MPPTEMDYHNSAISEAPSIERQSTADTFKLLANETRIDILRALSDSQGGQQFSKLFDSVTINDTGNFNYHLSQLTGTFVKKADNAYELTHAGEQIIGAMLAGTYTADATVEPISLDWNCLLCGGAMTAEYFGERAHISCQTCGKGAVFPFPSGCLTQFDRSELPAAFARWLRQLVKRTIAGFCHVCSGRVDGELARLPGGTEADPKPSQAAFECQRCGSGMRFSGATLATFHPEVESFFFEHDLHLLAGHASRAWGRLDRFDSRTLETDPPQIELIFAHDGETLTAEIMPDATIRTVQRYATDS